MHDSTCTYIYVCVYVGGWVCVCVCGWVGVCYISEEMQSEKTLNFEL